MSQTLSDRATWYGPRRRAFLTGIAALCIAAAALLGVSSRVMAFSSPQDFGRYATPDVYTLGLGGGRYYTGSPADAYSCDNCHSHPSGYSFPLVQKGLPLDGYSLDTVYKIELSSPAATTAWTQSASMGNDPVTTLTAEFVAENGESAGTIYFANGSETSLMAFPNQWCTAAKTAKADRVPFEYGMFIYEQDAGSLPIEITMANGTHGGTCTTGRGRDEDGAEYERRCIMTLRPCGAQSIKFMWRSPRKYAGPIWFSAGFVTTYDRSTQPNDNDFVTLMSVPLNPDYEGATHETVVDSGCSVAANQIGSRSGSSRGFGLVLAGLLSFIFARSRRRQMRSQVGSRFAWSRWISLLIVFACIGCSDGKGLVTDVSGSVGAYEVSTCYKKCILPLTCRDSAWPDAGTPESAAMAMASSMKPGAMMTPAADMGAAGNAAGGAAGAAAPAVPSLGTLAVQFVSAQPAGVVSNWQSKCPPEMRMCDPNYVAVWIENADKKYVRTLHDQKGMYIDLSIVNYKSLGSDCESNPTETPDVTSSATHLAHDPYMLEWDGLFGSGHKAAPAGSYTIHIEVAIDETNHIDVAEIPFTFGDPAPYTMTIPPAPAHAGVTLTYTPGTITSTPGMATPPPTSTP